MGNPLNGVDTAERARQLALNANRSGPTSLPGLPGGPLNETGVGAVLNDAANQVGPPSPNSPSPGPGSQIDAGSLALDLTQIGLDIVGIFEPTPFADGSNTVISLLRGNFLDAGISAVGIIPYVGDAAKLGKLGGWARTVANAVELAASSPQLARRLEPGLRAIKDAVDGIPQRALDSLPASAREAIESMKTKLDDFFGGAARQAGRPPVTIGDNIGATRVINGRQVTIGDAPNVITKPDGRRVALDVDGNEVTVRQPRTYDDRTVNADGSTTYTKDGQSVTYDADGFPLFDSKADVYLDPSHLKSGSDADHFRGRQRTIGRGFEEGSVIAGADGSDGCTGCSFDQKPAVLATSPGLYLASPPGYWSHAIG